MTKQLVASLILAFAITNIAQPSFAMKRSFPAPSDSISVMISTLVIAVKWFLARQPAVLDHDDPYSFRPDHVTFVSHSGTHFNVVANDLDAFLHLSRSITTLLSDLVGTDISTIPLPNVHDSALYVLTEMASGADHDGLLDYIRGLSDSAIEELKKEAELLDSQALTNLVSKAIDNPFTWLPPELLHLTLENVGPKSRSSSASVNRTFNGAVNIVRKPVAQGGLGCTDRPGVVATIVTGGFPWYPVANGQMLYVTKLADRAVSVIDPKTNKIVATIPVGKQPLPPVVHGHMLYVSNCGDDSVSVIDTNTNQVVATIAVSEHPLQPVVHGNSLYVSSGTGSIVSVIDTNTNQVVATIEVGNNQSQPVIHGQMLYVSNGRDGTISVINTSTNKVVGSIKGCRGYSKPEALGKMLYVLSQDEDTVSVIDTTTYKVVTKIQVGKFPVAQVIVSQMLYVVNHTDQTVSVIDTISNQVIATIAVGKSSVDPVAHGQILYLANSEDNTVTMIDTKTNKVIDTIAIGNKVHQIIVHGQKLYVVSMDDGIISVIDIGGYTPGQY